MDSTLDRRVVDWIDGAVNLRDFGGYPTTDGRRIRSGVLYRSGNTHGIATEGIARIADDLGVRTVIDLRSAGERDRARSAFEDHGIDVVHEPLDTGVGVDPALPRDAVVRAMATGAFDWAEMYWGLLHHNAERFARILDLLCEPARLPVIVHCAGGRDRTGVTVALVQAALGAGDDDIAEDFALSSQLLELGAPRVEFDRLFGEILDIPRVDIVRAMATRPETMHALLSRIRSTYGDVEGLLAAMGLAAKTVGALRACLCTSDEVGP